ncbi:leucine-rich single-pass membrane protein 2 isoform X1 [Sceloporus undulatus]|uniref:leucine-rich single-pass membrane protein 2 isoform X1 n=2 Tax=Sceloporus undulatus TaxID=8520 RepID=UPI001C4B2592|nr:leucine-rich single-pass membrane protein 2 isoform X1 [Sceloporus undulatus]
MSIEIAEDSMKDATSSDRELLELSDNDVAEINLHAVESLSDLHYTSSKHEGAKALRGSIQSQPNTPRTPQSATSSKHFTFPNEEDTAFLQVQNFHILPAFTCCPCFSPTCCPAGFFALLGVLVVASLGLATLAVYLSVLQRESLRVLAQWLESQEEAIRQMRAVSIQLWRQLNDSEPGAHT